jgi:hypothetical protein
LNGERWMKRVGWRGVDGEISMERLDMDEEIH